MQSTHVYDTIREAASHGDLEAIKRMHKAGYAWDQNATSEAAANGHLDCLIFLHTSGCPWSYHTPAYATSSGHLDCLRYAYENGCKWDFLTPFFAAQEGHLQCLRYACEHGCVENSMFFLCVAKHAARKFHLDCLEYAIENGYPYETEEVLQLIGENMPDSFEFENSYWFTQFLDTWLERDEERSSTNFTTVRLKSKYVEYKRKKTQQILQNELKDYLICDVIKYCLYTFIL
jgi:hypothetical protein